MPGRVVAQIHTLMHEHDWRELPRHLRWRLMTIDDDEAVARSRLKRRKNFSDVEDDNQSEVIATPKLMKPVKKPVISHDVPVPSGLLSGGKGQRFSSI